MQDFWDQSFLGNTMLAWLAALIILVLVWGSLQILRRLLKERVVQVAGRANRYLGILVGTIADNTNSIFLFILALALASQALTLSPTAQEWVSTVLVMATLIQTALWAIGLIDHFTHSTPTDGTRQGLSPTEILLVGMFSKVLIWTIITLLILDNLPGVEITSLLTSLGIGGVAVALALQSILSDLFSALSIALDKPFVVGDYIVVDDLRGTVEHIGLKSTRIRSLSGEQLVFANSDMLSSRIRNLERMKQRMVDIELYVSYNTPRDKLALIPKIMEEVIRAQPRAQFEGAYLTCFGKLAVEYEAFFYSLDPDYGSFAGIRQTVNLGILERFAAEGIELARATGPAMVVA